MGVNRRKVGAAMAAALLCTPALARESFSIKTVAGTLTAACEKAPGSAFDGTYRYRLDGRPLAMLEEDCTPGGASSSVAVRRSWAAPGRTILLALEDHSRIDQTLRLFQFRRGLPPLMVKGWGGDIVSMERLGPDKFRITVRGEGFGAPEPSSTSYHCRYVVDFAARSATARFFGRHERSLPEDTCGHPKVQALRVE
jgi:hypothetical protein